MSFGSHEGEAVRPALSKVYVLSSFLDVGEGGCCCDHILCTGTPSSTSEICREVDTCGAMDWAMSTLSPNHNQI